MCSGSEEGSYLNDHIFVYHSTLGPRVLKQENKGAPHSGFRVQGLWFRVQGFQGSGFRVQGSGCRVEALGLRVEG